MKDNMKKALLNSYKLRKKAEEVQMEKGTVDVGLRSQVTSGKHMDEIALLVSQDLIQMGVDEDEIHC